MLINLLEKFKFLNIQLKHGKKCKGQGHTIEKFICTMAQKLVEIQQKLMMNPMDNSLPMQKQPLQNKIQHHLLEQEID